MRVPPVHSDTRLLKSLLFVRSDLAQTDGKFIADARSGELTESGVLSLGVKIRPRCPSVLRMEEVRVAVTDTSGQLDELLHLPNWIALCEVPAH